MSALDEPRLLRLLAPSPERWAALPAGLRRALLVQLDHVASRRAARELGRLLEAPWWWALVHDDEGDAIRAVRVVAHAAAIADGSPRPPAPDAPCRRTLLDDTLDALLPPHGRFELRFAALTQGPGEVVAGACLLPSTVVLDRGAVAASDAAVGQGPPGELEAYVATCTLAHEVHHLCHAVPPGPTYAAFEDEYCAWVVGFVVGADRLPRRVEALDRCRELLTSPRYAALARAVTSGSREGARILALLGELGPVARLEDLEALPRDGWLEPAPLPRSRAAVRNRPLAAGAGSSAAIAGSA
jgi:hypothetical protein